MSTVTTKQDPMETLDHKSHPPYLMAFGILAILTIVEIGVGSFETNTLVLVVLVLLAISKVAIVAAVFMHVMYEKDSKQIVFTSFLVPLIGVVLLTLTILLDYRDF